MNRAEKIAEDLLSIGAVFFRPDEPFLWASGIKSPVYCDNRLTLSDPAVRKDVEEGIAAVVREEYPDAEVLMGTSTAGIAHEFELAEGFDRLAKLAQHQQRLGDLVAGTWVVRTQEYEKVDFSSLEAEEG